ncbi:hypothetical protein Ahia01_001282700, partial [Argonauta hians]
MTDSDVKKPEFFPAGSFYGPSRKRRRIEKSLEGKAARFSREKIPHRYPARITGPSPTWKPFFRQSEAFDYVRTLPKMDLRVFAYQSEMFTSREAQGQRMYLVAPYAVFWHYYTQLDENKRCHYEIIPEGAVCKLYFDLEFYTEMNPGLDGHKVGDHFIEYVCTWLRHLFNIACDSSCVLRLDSSTSTKYSEHLIFVLHQVAFKDNLHVGSFVKFICCQLLDWLRMHHHHHHHRPSDSSLTLSTPRSLPLKPSTTLSPPPPPLPLKTDTPSQQQPTTTTNPTSPPPLLTATTTSTTSSSSSPSPLLTATTTTTSSSSSSLLTATTTTTSSSSSSLLTATTTTTSSSSSSLLTATTTTTSSSSSSLLTATTTTTSSSSSSLLTATTTTTSSSSSSLLTATTTTSSSSSSSPPSPYSPAAVPVVVSGREVECDVGRLLSQFPLSSLRGMVVLDREGDTTSICDLGVYTKNRNFRLFLSSKLGRSNPLRVSDHCQYRHTTDTHPADRSNPLRVSSHCQHHHTMDTHTAGHSNPLRVSSHCQYRHTMDTHPAGHCQLDKKEGDQGRPVDDKDIFYTSLIANVPYHPELKILTFGTKDEVRLRQKRLFMTHRTTDNNDLMRGDYSGSNPSPSPYPEVDAFITATVTSGGHSGRIFRWMYFSRESLLSYDIAGGYRWCGNVGREHRSNNIRLLVDLKQNVFFQKCHDPDCRRINYRSEDSPLPPDLLSWLSDQTLDEEYEEEEDSLLLEEEGEEDDSLLVAATEATER